MAHRLVIKRKGKRPQIFRLLQSSVVIGRGHGTDLLLPDVSVSRQHARVVKQDDGNHTIVDLKSQNGTKVNGQRITEQPLEDGDELQIGKFILTYEQKIARTVEDDDTMPSYSLDDERTGFLKAVSQVAGDTAHQTSALSKDELDLLRGQIQLQESAKIVNVATGTVHQIGKTGLNFGKAGIAVSGAGLGGSARIEWDGAVHVVEKTGGLLFSVTVNGVKIAHSQPLSLGDVVEIGKSRFSYEV